MQSWREWCESFKQVEDYSFATLLRLDAGADYSEANTIIVTKVQFYAIELARNREGANDGIRGAFKPTPRKRKPVPRPKLEKLLMPVQKHNWKPNRRRKLRFE